jgi:hypothetical protein
MPEVCWKCNLVSFGGWRNGATSAAGDEVAVFSRRHKNIISLGVKSWPCIYIAQRIRCLLAGYLARSLRIISTYSKLAVNSSNCESSAHNLEFMSDCLFACFISKHCRRNCIIEIIEKNSPLLSRTQCVQMNTSVKQFTRPSDSNISVPLCTYISKPGLLCGPHISI